MKRIIAIFLLVVALADLSVAEGQSRYLRRPVSKLGYGIKGGANLTWQASPGNDANVTIRDIIGVNVGGFCNYFFQRQMAFQGELMVSGRGSHWKDFYDNMKDIVTYLDVPLLFRYQPLKYLNVHAGPVISYRINATQKDMTADVKSEIKDYYESFELSMAAGAEINLPSHINFTVRYIHGFTPATTAVEYVDPWYNRMIQVSVGYRFAGK